MRRIFSREFWNTPILDMTMEDKMRALLLFFGMFMLCVIVGGIAAWQIFYR